MEIIVPLLKTNDNYTLSLIERCIKDNRQTQVYDSDLNYLNFNKNIIYVERERIKNIASVWNYLLSEFIINSRPSHKVWMVKRIMDDEYACDRYYPAEYNPLTHNWEYGLKENLPLIYLKDLEKGGFINAI